MNGLRAHTLDRPVLDHEDELTPWDVMQPGLAIDGDGAVLDAAGVARRCAVLGAPPPACRPPR